MNSPLVKQRPSAYGVSFRDGRLLAVWSRGRWHLPGGGVRRCEDVVQALAREVMEEAGYPVVEWAFLGRADEYVPRKKGTPVLKQGIFFRMRVGDKVPGGRTEHDPHWIDPHVFLCGRSFQFYKWAVKQALLGGV